MADIPRSQIKYGSVRDMSCVEQIMINTAMGLGAGVTVSLLTFTIQHQALYSKRAIFQGLLGEFVPSLTAAALVFTTVACSIESTRGVRDEWNSVAGGFAGGFTYGALVTRTPQGPFISGLLGAAAAGLADLSERLDPTLEESVPKQDPHSMIAPPPAEFARSAAISANSSARMLR